MAMNKVVHAAQRAAFSVAIDATINAVRGKGPENMAEQAVKLVNLAQPLLAKRYPDANWDAVRAFVSDPNSTPSTLSASTLQAGLPASALPSRAGRMSARAPSFSTWPFLITTILSAMFKMRS